MLVRPGEVSPIEALSSTSSKKHDSSSSSSSSSAFRSGIDGRKYRVPERRRSCATQCVSDVICGCHGDAIDWPTRRQTSRESRRHSDYCPLPAPRTDRHPLQSSLPEYPPSFASMYVAHNATTLHVYCPLYSIHNRVSLCESTLHHPQIFT